MMMKKISLFLIINFLVACTTTSNTTQTTDVTPEEIKAKIRYAGVPAQGSGYNDLKMYEECKPNEDTRQVNQLISLKSIDDTKIVKEIPADTSYLFGISLKNENHFGLFVWSMLVKENSNYVVKQTYEGSTGMKRINLSVTEDDKPLDILHSRVRSITCNTR